MTEAVSSAVDAALDRLRAHDQRVTPARRTIIELLAGTDDHLSADEIVTRLAGESNTGSETANPGNRTGRAEVHRATVFRALTTLTELGVLSHTHLPGSATVYHLATFEPDAAQPGRPPHAHLQCAACGTVIDVSTATLEPLARRLHDELGFRLAAEHAALLGTCRACAEKLSPGR